MPNRQTTIRNTPGFRSYPSSSRRMRNPCRTQRRSWKRWTNDFRSRQSIRRTRSAKLVSTLLEEFGDEWGNKWMFHLRWARDEDCTSAGGRIAALNAPDADDATHATIREQVIGHMKGRVFFVGSNEQTAPQIEQFVPRRHSAAEYAPGRQTLSLRGQTGVCRILASGARCTARGQTRPVVPGSRASAPHLLDWVHRMLWPSDEGDYEPWDSVAPTLLPFVKDQVGDLFLPWTVANAAAMAAGEAKFSVDLKGRAFTQENHRNIMRSRLGFCARNMRP